jgi:hypothetical protein
VALSGCKRRRLKSLLILDQCSVWGARTLKSGVGYRCVFDALFLLEPVKIVSVNHIVSREHEIMAYFAYALLHLSL